MHKNATKCNETLSKWCKNKHGASKIMDTLETYQLLIPSFKNSIVRATKVTKISPLNPPKLLIFGESKEEALIYILTEAIYFPLSFA
jgi:hypothetical protein